VIFLKKVYQTVENGGKVLIPVFALGRAQELCILLEQFWKRMNLGKVPVYFSMGLSEKATNFYKLFLTWTNEKIKQTFMERNAFDYEHIKPFDRSYADNPGPMVVLATPGMLHAGLSLELFKKWCHSELNTIIMPGYCVAGTTGHKVLNGLKTIELRNGFKAQIKLNVEYMSFSAHADAKGIMQLIRTAQPKNVMLCHGEGEKMQFLSDKIKQELGIKCYTPANGQTVTIPAEMELVINCEKRMLDELEKEHGPVGLTASVGEDITNRRRVVLGENTGDRSVDDDVRASKKRKIVNAALVITNSDDMRIVSDKEACKEFKVARHMVNLGCRFEFIENLFLDMLEVLEISLKRFSLVNYESFLKELESVLKIVDKFSSNGDVKSEELDKNGNINMTKILGKEIPLYKSFQLILDGGYFNFTWNVQDDDFVDEFMIEFNRRRDILIGGMDSK
jgi:hypothetical protein